LLRLYGGALALKPVALYANFVQTIDGVVALPGVESSGSVISGKNPADRFVMGLLRATASAVMVGAGTLRDTPLHHWTADHVYPEMVNEWAKLREAMGLTAQPRLVVITAGGDIDVAHPAIRGGATVLTGAAGAAKLDGILPDGCELKAWDTERVPLGDALAWLRAQGHARILSEAGPTVMGQLLEEDLVNDVFVTVSPVFAGRNIGARLGLVAGVELLPGRRIEPGVTGVRRSGDYLLLRYSLG
jgi:riboflavin biosynthesis pyrimidine reductase